jgi:hypothetical protein
LVKTTGGEGIKKTTQIYPVTIKYENLSITQKIGTKCKNEIIVKLASMKKQKYCHWTQQKIQHGRAHTPHTFLKT